MSSIVLSYITKSKARIIRTRTINARTIRKLTECVADEAAWTKEDSDLRECFVYGYYTRKSVRENKQ